MAWRYCKVDFGGSSSTETNPYEINILAGAMQCQKGGTITSDRAPVWSTLATLIDGNLTTATYWDAGYNPEIIITMPIAYLGITAIEIPHTFAHFQHDVYLSEDNINWYWCPFVSFTNANKQQNFSIPDLPQANKNFTANGTLNITRYTYGATQNFTPYHYNFTANGTLNIGFTENAQKIYTAHGYEYNQWSLNYLDYYFFTDQIYTANGYEFNLSIPDPLTLSENAIQDYTANGLNFTGVVEQNIILDFAAAQQYTPQGYNFAASTQENIYFNYIGSQTYTADGYDVASMAQENILMVSIAGQVYTPQGLSFEATSQDDFSLSDAATQIFWANFEQNPQEIINLTLEAAQTFTAHFENTAQLNFALNIGAAQTYTAIGYKRETTATETIAIDTTTAQIFARYYDQTAIDGINLFAAANVVFQANFESNAAQTILIEDLATATAIFSNGLQFQNAAEQNFSLLDAAAQTFTAFGGYTFNQSAVNNFALSDAAASFYELGETGVYHQWATHYLYLQEAATNVYTRNWLDFEATAAENFINEFWSEAASVHTQVNIYEANAAEDLTFYNNPLQFYGKHFEGTSQDIFGLSINAANERTEKYLTFEMQANEFFFLHFTDSAVQEIIYLQIQQNMYYDFVFWDYADQFYSNEYLEFTPKATEIIDLSINSAGQYTNANMLNGFAAENISLITGATAEHTQVIINEFIALSTENINLNMGAVVEYVETTIYEFNSNISGNINFSFGATSDYLNVHIFENLTAHTIAINVQALSEYKHINVFKSKAIEPIDFEHYATFLVTTEPRNYISNKQVNFNLKIVNWVYFESDIYKPTYKLEITKPNTLWEPLEQDRPMVEANQRPRQGANVDDTIFGGQDDFKIDRRILNLTHIDEPTQISYASEIKKPNTLYTNNNENERGLID